MTTVRARDLGIPFEGTAGPLNAITDVAGVEVGHVTLIEGEGPLIVGQGPVRTGVTAVLPRGKRYDPVFAGLHVLNGNGEMTGTQWIEASGFLDGPVMLTNTHSVGVVRDAVIAWKNVHHQYDALDMGFYWILPCATETYDGLLNDINGFHVTAEHTFAALDGASPGPVEEGSVGGGTGMICHEFKGGVGTSSRLINIEETSYTLGVLVQANHGARRNLTLAGVPVGKHIPDLMPISDGVRSEPDTGSIIVIVATDAPLLPHQLKRVAQRATFGLGRVGTFGSHTSGDIFLAFSTANPGAAQRSSVRDVQILANEHINPLFEATVQATEEAIVNAMTAAQTMVGINGNTVYGMPHERVREVMAKYNRLDE